MKKLPLGLMVLVLAVGGEAARANAPIPPLPKSLARDEYGSRAEFLQKAAEFETDRLRVARRSNRQEGAIFAAKAPAVFSVTVAPGLELSFCRIPSGRYTDGLTPALKEKIFSTPNRSGDLRRWEKDLETDRIDRVDVPYDFFMSETYVTQAMFAAFVRETGYRTTVSRYQTGWIVTSEARWLQGFANEFDLQVPPTSEADHPVVQVSWFDAMQFATWLGHKAGVTLRVPTKEEWLLAGRPAAMSSVPCVFPWGNDFSRLDERMNFGSRELDYAWVHDQFHDGYARSSPVKAFAADTRGLHDMLGNVWTWNWTNAARYEARPRGDRQAQPAPLAELAVAGNERITMQGGCYLARLSHANLLGKMGHPALDGAEDIGFRLVAVRTQDSGLPR